MSCYALWPKPATQYTCAECAMIGCWPYVAYDSLKEAGGMFSEAAWPYQHTSIYPCMPAGYNLQFGAMSGLYGASWPWMQGG
mmetsp:Transcript_4475/g.7733  ORF Transcript_4475/g.7733 Transcript_4475/m.7733 type:complete len:82 (+) Transcript_4475:48-293(+)